MSFHRFVSVQFYPAYEVGSMSASGRYVALDEDGQVYVWAMDVGSPKKWIRLADPKDET
jgi:hypothetical protein